MVVTSFNCTDVLESEVQAEHSCEARAELSNASVCSMKRNRRARIRRAPRPSRRRDLKRAMLHAHPRLPLGTVPPQALEAFRAASQQPCGNILSPAERAVEWRLRLTARRKARLGTVKGPAARPPSAARRKPSHDDKDVSTVHFLRGLWRRIIAGKTDFASYVRRLTSAYQGKKDFQPHDTGNKKCSSTWPIPLPFPALVCSTPSRLGQRVGKRTALQILANLQCCMLNFLACGSSPIINIGLPTSSQQYVYGTLETANAAFLRLVGPAIKSRVAGKIRIVADELSCLFESVSGLQDTSAYARFGAGRIEKGGLKSAPPESLLTSRLALPSRGASVDIRPYLDPDLCEQYEFPGFTSEDWPSRLPRARVHADRTEFLKLCKRLSLAGMLEVLPPHECVVKLYDVRRTHTSYPVGEHDVPFDPLAIPRAGAFPVKKSADIDRFIFNRIPRNSLEDSPGFASNLLPHGALYCELQVDRGQMTRLWTQDLSDYYHMIACPPSRIATNAFGPLLDPHEYATLAGAESLRAGPGQPCLRSLPMGDIGAVDFACAAHIGLLRSYDILLPENTLRYRSPVPRSALWESVYIDDHAVVEVGPIKRPVTHWRANHIMDRAREAYDSAGFPQAKHKEVCGARRGLIIGAELDAEDSSRITVGTQSSKLAELMAISIRAWEIEWTTSDLLDRIRGSWVFPFMFRREAFSMFHSIFDLSCSDRNRIFKFPRAARDELLAAALLAPLLRTEVTTPVSTRVLASDAAPGGQGGASADIAVDAAKELWRLRERRGGHLTAIRAQTLVRADRLAAKAEVFDAYDEGRAPCMFPRTWVDEMCASLQFQPTFSAPIKTDVHINVGEAIARRTTIRRLTRQPACRRKRHVVLLDSRVLLGAAVKGRSPSRRLNAVLKHSVPDILAFQLQLGHAWVSTAFNPADGPSRRKRVPRRVQSPAKWACDFVHGDASAIGRANHPIIDFDTLVQKGVPRCVLSTGGHLLSPPATAENP